MSPHVLCLTPAGWAARPAGVGWSVTLCQPGYHKSPASPPRANIVTLHSGNHCMPSYMRHNHKRQYRGPDIALCRCIPATYRGWSRQNRRCRCRLVDRVVCPRQSGSSHHPILCPAIASQAVPIFPRAVYLDDYPGKTATKRTYSFYRHLVSFITSCLVIPCRASGVNARSISPASLGHDARIMNTTIATPPRAVMCAHAPSRQCTGQRASGSARSTTALRWTREPQRGQKFITRMGRRLVIVTLCYTLRFVTRFSILNAYMGVYILVHAGNRRYKV